MNDFSAPLPAAPQGIILVRPEQAAWHEAIDRIHEAAFGRPQEGQLVRQLRQAQGYHPRFGLVALADGAMVGHVMLSQARVEGHSAEILALGPLGVLPDYQKHGIGAALVYEALEQARKAKAERMILLGEPRYYGRFGFVPAREYGLSSQWGDGPEFMALALRPDAWAGISGRVLYDAAFTAL